MLIEFGANVDFGDLDGDSPLWGAAKEVSGNLCVRLVETRGASGGGGGPGWRLQGHLEAAKLLLDAGANIDSERASGEAPLWMAAYYGHNAIVQVCFGTEVSPWSAFSVVYCTPPWFAASCRGLRKGNC